MVMRSAAKILICHASLSQLAMEAGGLVGLDRSKIFTIHGSVRDVAELKLDAVPMKQVDFTEDEIKTKPAFLCYSSGTTGRSKVRFY